MINKNIYLHYKRSFISTKHSEHWQIVLWRQNQENMEEDYLIFEVDLSLSDTGQTLSRHKGPIQFMLAYWYHDQTLYLLVIKIILNKMDQLLCQRKQKMEGFLVQFQCIRCSAEVEYKVPQLPKINEINTTFLLRFVISNNSTYLTVHTK